MSTHIRAQKLGDYIDRPPISFHTYIHPDIKDDQEGREILARKLLKRGLGIKAVAFITDLPPWLLQRQSFRDKVITPKLTAHEREERDKQAKLRLQILNYYKAGLPQVTIAQLTGMSQPYVSKIVSELKPLPRPSRRVEPPIPKREEPPTPKPRKPRVRRTREDSARLKEEVARLHQEGLSGYAIAQRLGIHFTYVYQLLRENTVHER